MVERATILIVDDEPTNVHALAACLKDEYRVKVATTGKRCLELVRGEGRPDLIFLDVVMPEMDGFEVIRELKADPETESLPVIFVTGKDNDEEEEAGLALGAVDYLTKPIHPTVVVARAKNHLLLKQQRDQLLDMAMYDQLTDLYNRHYLVEVADQSLSHAYRHQSALSILMIDIDLFKSINDEHGRLEGDKVLVEVAKVLKVACRKEDVVARFGGEEFVIILTDCNLHDAKIKAESIRDSIEKLKPAGHSVTVSIGVASSDPKTKMIKKFDELHLRANNALYKAKKNGRNCIEVLVDG